LRTLMEHRIAPGNLAAVADYADNS
jgi:hypothetical protein